MVEENEPCPEVYHVIGSSRIHDLGSSVATTVTKWLSRQLQGRLVVTHDLTVHHGGGSTVVVVAGSQAAWKYPEGSGKL